MTDTENAQPDSAAGVETILPPTKTRKPGRPAKKTAGLEILVPGKSLRPAATEIVRGDTRFFWCGLMPSLAGRNSIDIAGYTFAKITEDVLNRDNGEPSDRIPAIGIVQEFTKEQLHMIAERLSSMRYVFEQAIPADYKMAGYDIRAYQQRPIRYNDPSDITPEMGHLRGHPVRLPTEKWSAARRKAGMPVNTYNPGPHDADLADHVFCVPCANQDVPLCGGVIPEPVSVTGLVWPEE